MSRVRKMRMFPVLNAVALGQTRQKADTPGKTGQNGG